MSQDGLKALQAELRGPPPAALSELSPDQLRSLAKAIRDARHRQAAELSAAGDDALKHIPKMLRVPVRRMFG
jgi:hypothetical protein